MPAYFFLHCPSGQSWPTDDPHQWLLDHRDDELLATARERLVLSPDDPERCLRVGARRCNLALVQIVADDKIVAHHWRDPAPGLRQWAKEQGFNRTGIQVVFTNVKNNKMVVHENAEDVLMYGEQVGTRFPWFEYTAKHERRHVEEPDDQDAAWDASTNFVWEDGPEGQLTWRLLKAIWRTESALCPNCDVPLLLTSFRWQMGPLSFRSAQVFRHCSRCHRRFEAHEPEPLSWLASVLPPALRPTHLEQWRTFEIDWSSLGFKHRRTVQVTGQEE